jgi:hypothetical protein
MVEMRIRGKYEQKTFKPSNIYQEVALPVVYPDRRLRSAVPRPTVTGLVLQQCVFASIVLAALAGELF